MRFLRGIYGAFLLILGLAVFLLGCAGFWAYFSKHEIALLAAGVVGISISMGLFFLAFRRFRNQSVNIGPRLSPEQILANKEAREFDLETRASYSTMSVFIIAVLFAIHFGLCKLLKVSPLVVTPESLIEMGGNGRWLLNRHEYWRLLTSVLLHGGLVHLACNAVCLYSVGPLMDRQFGKFNYAIIFFVSGLTGSLLSAFNLEASCVGDFASVGPVPGFGEDVETFWFRTSPSFPFDFLQLDDSAYGPIAGPTRLTCDRKPCAIRNFVCAGIQQLSLK